VRFAISSQPDIFALECASPGFMVTIAEIEELLEQTGIGLASVFEIYPDMVFLVDRDERVIYLNRVAAQALGRMPEEVVGRCQSELFRGDLGARHSAAIQSVFRSGESVVTENQDNLNLRPVWIDTRLVPFRDPSGTIVAVVGIVRNVSAQREAQEAVALREAYLRSMLDNFPYLVWFKDIAGKFLVVNQAFASAFDKKDPSEVVGLDDFAIGPHKLALHYVSDDQEVMRTGHKKLVEEEICVNGQSRWFETYKSPVLNTSGELLGTTGFARDITDRRQLQEGQRRSREQLRALAAHVESVREQERVRIAREIHDELGQSLTCMGMDLAFLDKHIDPQDKEATARVAALVELVKDTIRCVRRISSELRPSILDDLGLGAAIEWLAHDFETRTHITCKVEVPEDLSLPFDRATPLFRICQEALTNVTRHASATHVDIRLTCSDATIDLAIHDNGRGITDEEIQRHGSLGLLGMKERVSILGGSLEVVGRPGEGTTLAVQIPMNEAPRLRP
jgi:two-component system sensor histidine kinase UhpB